MLSVKNLHFAYKSNRVLRGLDLDVAEGELVGVVGPNGCGKTTLLQLVSGLLEPDEGDIRVNGTTLGSLGPSERARLISVVPQSPQLPLGFTVKELVLMGRNPHLRLLQWEGPGDIEVAERAMEMTGLASLRERTLATLSGGERQRALVAMALAQESPVLLLDEPTASLDLAHQTRIMDLARDVQARRGGAMLVSMHDLTLAAQYCDRLVMMAGGRGHATGTPTEVLTPENIAAAYGTEVFVLPHPVGGTPVVLPLRTAADSNGARD